MLAKEQLLLHKGKSAALKTFTEGPITFLPTFKYDIGTDTFDTSKKRRTPSWCDRILYRHNEKLSHCR
jgi:hypothetical protein